ncbi:TonB family protein [Flavihumibacter profundi]|uniref:TonB family protein n=1 Tax=Flavihumibacter profundi TaxID=2716883 RepID=UPI001CC5ED0B|nr:TonB family protein [Flavihumibacter profundi]MBZ5859480.1 energy transducer TonB [Flavihumibacter profundi]
MKPELILRSDLLDILFENRNKAYGAYALRRNYTLHLVTGIVGMVLLVAGFWILLPKYPGNGKLSNLLPFILTDTIRLAPTPDFSTPPPPPPPPIQHRPRISTVGFGAPVIDPNVENSGIPDQDDLAQSRIGTENFTGEPGDNTAPGPASNGQATMPAAPVQPPMEEAPEVLETATVMPQFPGGEAALQRWLSKQLRPQEGQQAGERVKVVVRFVVGKTGEIGQVELVKQGGDPYDSEVIRVMKKMPRWEAGQQHGRAVNVWFYIPIIFEMPEQ